jgi:hypothetical protein
MDKTNHETHMKLHMQALANSMMETKMNLVRTLLDELPMYSDINKHQIEVDFDGKD